MATRNRDDEAVNIADRVRAAALNLTHWCIRLARMGLGWVFDDRVPPAWAKSMESRISQQIGEVMASLSEVLEGFKSWGTSWKDQATAEKARADAAVAALGDMPQQLQAAADALAQFQADDAATDATQLAQQAQADADAAQAKLDEVLAADVPPEPPAEPPAVPDTVG